MNQFSGKSKEKKREIILYDEKGVQEKIHQCPTKIKEFWMNIYNKERNNIHEIWNNNNIKQEYENTLKNYYDNKSINIDND